jgi:hypothetical protein
VHSGRCSRRKVPLDLDPDEAGAAGAYQRFAFMGLEETKRNSMPMPQNLLAIPNRHLICEH